MAQKLVIDVSGLLAVKLVHTIKQVWVFCFVMMPVVQIQKVVIRRISLPVRFKYAWPKAMKSGEPQSIVGDQLLDFRDGELMFLFVKQQISTA